MARWVHKVGRFGADNSFIKGGRNTKIRQTVWVINSFL